MKSLFTLLTILLFNFTNSQSNGYIVQNNDTIKVTFNLEDLTVRSYGKIEKLQEKVKYFLNLNFSKSFFFYEHQKWCHKVDQSNSLMTLLQSKVLKSTLHLNNEFRL